MGKGNKIVIALSVVVGILFFIFVGLAVSYYVSDLAKHINEQNAQVADSSNQEQKDNEPKKKNDEVKKNNSSGASFSNEITTKIYIPTEFDINARSNYYVIIRNDGEKHFEGSFRINNIKTQRETDKLGYLKLDPHEAKIIPCVGAVLNEDSIDISLDGDFTGEVYQIDKSLEYTIISKDISNPKSKTGSSKLFIYVQPNVSDDDYLTICKEIKRNYDTGLIIADFSPVMINPNKDDTRITFAQNKMMKFSHVMFYTTDETNVTIQEMERRIVDI